MRTATVHTHPQDANQSVNRAHKTILTFSVILSLGALITHHPGLVTLIAAGGFLVKVVIQRITETLEAGTPTHVSGLLTHRRVTDGGSFRAQEAKKESPRSRQGVIVMDGGID